MKKLIGLLKETRPLPVIATLIAINSTALTTKQINADLIYYSISIFFLLYAVHCLDTIEDRFIRKEDQLKTTSFAHGSQGELTRNDLQLASNIALFCFSLITIILTTKIGLIFLTLNLVAFLIAITYSNYLSKNLLTGIISPSLGVAISMFSALVITNTPLTLPAISYICSVFLLMLTCKITLDCLDTQIDKTTNKPNLANAIGTHNTRKLTLVIQLTALLIYLATNYSEINLITITLLLAIFVMSYFVKISKSIYLTSITTLLFMISKILLH